MDKVDFKRALDTYHAPRNAFRLVDVPEMTYLMVDGHGDPNASPLFEQSLKVLYPVAYRMKFASRNQLGRDYVVPPLEGLWWAEDMEFFTAARNKARWQWTLMLLVPDWVGAEMCAAAIDEVGAATRPEGLDRLRVECVSEGLCVQTLHVGPFDAEAEILARLHDEFVPAEHLRMTGKHHEVYLSDNRRVEPERRRTILRQPVRRTAS